MDPRQIKKIIVSETAWVDPLTQDRIVLWEQYPPRHGVLRRFVVHQEVLPNLRPSFFQAGDYDLLWGAALTTFERRARACLGKSDMDVAYLCPECGGRFLKVALSISMLPLCLKCTPQMDVLCCPLCLHAGHDHCSYCQGKAILDRETVRKLYGL